MRARISIVILLLASCSKAKTSAGPSAQTPEPEERPSDFEARVSSGNDHAGVSWSSEIVGTTATYASASMDRSIVVRSVLTEAQLDDLWATLRTLELRKIREGERANIIHDASRTFLKVKAGTLAVDAGSTGGQEIVEGRRGFSDAIDAIKAVTVGDAGGTPVDLVVSAQGGPRIEVIFDVKGAAPTVDDAKSHEGKWRLGFPDGKTQVQAVARAYAGGSQEQVGEAKLAFVPADTPSLRALYEGGKLVLTTGSSAAGPAPVEPATISAPFVVEYGEDQQGGTLIVGDSLFVHDNGLLELVPGGRASGALEHHVPHVARVDVREVEALSRLIGDPALRSVPWADVTAGNSVRINIRTPKRRLAIQLAVGDTPVPAEVKPVHDELLRLREIARTSAKRVDMLADFSVTVTQERDGNPPEVEWALTVRSAGEVQLAQPAADAQQVSVPAGDLRRLALLLGSPSLQALESDPGAPEHGELRIEVESPAWSTTVTFLRPLPRPVALFLRELMNVRDRAGLSR